VWREIDVGEWEGRPLAELPPGQEASWRGGDLVPPGGEPWPELEARVADALDALLAAGGEWLVVTHGGVIRAAVSYATGADAQRISGPENASLTVLGHRRLHVFGWTPDGTVPGLSSPGPQVPLRGGVMSHRPRPPGP
jgi:broad specificity phosphatase PhoE